jgi:hypothetical protein
VLIHSPPAGETVDRRKASPPGQRSGDPLLDEGRCEGYDRPADLAQHHKTNTTRVVPSRTGLIPGDCRPP